jgi:hypothetical protein
LDIKPLTYSRRTRKTDGITRADVRDALLRSGYLLERRVADWLREADWAPFANKPYADPNTGETRELDVEAFRTYFAGPHRLDTILPTLLIECVNNPQPVAFIASDPRWADLHVKAFRYAGEPSGIFQSSESDEIVSLEAFCDLPSIHHYCKGVFATQYCSFEQKNRGAGKGEWFATHSSEHHKVFTDLIDALDQHVDRRDSELPRKAVPGVWLSLFYPILVLQGEIYAARVTRRSVRLKKVEHIQYRRTVMSRGEQTTYHIDVISERHLPKLVQQIQIESKHIARILSENAPEVQRSSDWLRRLAQHPA